MRVAPPSVVRVVVAATVACLVGLAPAVSGAGAAEMQGSVAKKNTRITSMSLRLNGRNPGEGYYVQVVVRVRVCGRPGEAVLRITESSSPPNVNRPVQARTRRRRERQQEGRCDLHRVSWRLGDKFFGVSRYRVGVRARTTGRDWSRVVSRHQDTYD